MVLQCKKIQSLINKNFRTGVLESLLLSHPLPWCDAYPSCGPLGWENWQFESLQEEMGRITSCWYSCVYLELFLCCFVVFFFYLFFPPSQPLFASQGLPAETREWQICLAQPQPSRAAVCHLLSPPAGQWGQCCAGGHRMKLKLDRPQALLLLTPGKAGWSHGEPGWTLLPGWHKVCKILYWDI